jgi:predicted phage terminase large subunit-like protein
VFCGGRGAGKTRSGAEWVTERVAKGARYISLIAPTSADCRDVLLEGPAGILTISPSHLRPIYQPSLRKVVWPNGAQALLFSSDEPDRLRGPQSDTVWIDELCAMRTAQDVLDMAMFGLRLGKDPRCLITTTPRPIKCFKALLAREGQDIVVTRSSSYRNRDNLAPAFFGQIVSKYAGTRLGRQELDAELLTDVPGALWHLERIEELRVTRGPQPYQRVVVAIDPATTFGPDSDETGLVIAALGQDGHAYILDDLSGRYPPEEWARRAIQAYRQYCADRIIAEVNQGGTLVEATLRSVDPAIPFGSVHASRGKLTRAEPISALYERGLVHHIGVFGPLEGQMTSYDGSRTGSSPDRLDALVYGVTALMLTAPPGGLFREESLLVKMPTGQAAPVGLPRHADLIFASIAAAVAEPDAMAVVLFAHSRENGMHPPLVVVDWDIRQIEPALIKGWLYGIVKRMHELEAACEVLYPGYDTIFVEPTGMGEVIAEQAEAADVIVEMIAEAEIAEKLPAQRALLASAYQTKIATAAHEQMQAFKGVTRNHLLHQILAFGLNKEREEPPGELLMAFANAVLRTFRDPKMRARA